MKKKSNVCSILICIWLSCFVVLFWRPVFGRMFKCSPPAGSCCVFIITSFFRTICVLGSRPLTSFKREKIALPPRHFHIPFPPFSPSLINLLVSVDVKHHAYIFSRPARCASSASSWTSACASPRPCPTCRGTTSPSAASSPTGRASWRAGAATARATTCPSSRWPARSACCRSWPTTGRTRPRASATSRAARPPTRSPYRCPTGRWSSTSCTPCRYVVGGED